MSRETFNRVLIALGVFGVLVGGAFAMGGRSDDLAVTAQVFNPAGRQIGVMVNGRFRPHAGAVQMSELLACSPAIERGPVWAFCRDGYYFSNVFTYRKFMAAKRALAHYTGPVIIQVGGRQSQSYLDDGWLH